MWGEGLEHVLLGFSVRGGRYGVVYDAEIVIRFCDLNPEL